ncbi:MAG: L-serine ammonia-lyase [Bryobacterales bacterium]|nr:L-serine ammonia-lyase [Bryobacterales bacterium]
MRTSLFDLFKIGIGPSSSHTVGPMRAAHRFVGELESMGALGGTCRVVIDLYGSLALTGVGHGTDKAVVLGLGGQRPEQVDPASVEGLLGKVRESRQLALGGTHAIPFEESQDVLFRRDQMLAAHSNGMRFSAFDGAGDALHRRVYYSTGGGFVQAEGESSNAAERPPVPHPFSSGDDLLKQGQLLGLPLWEVMLRNEMAWRTEREIKQGILDIWSVMQKCLRRGLTIEGTLPGGLNVRRRAPHLYRKLMTQGSKDPLAPMDWVNVFAMAVNEENAAGGRVVTAPTNGAAGVIPAVLQYYVQFLNGDSAGVIRFFLASAAIGVLYKENASISGAEVGCQGEVGVACSMAAAGLASALNGPNEAVEHAAEIGMEHNLGMTCDPIGGLVQIPCIERNAFGAVKAVNAARMALREPEGHKVTLDQVIKTMYQTGLDMQSKYKETSLGGLALNVIEC